MIKFTYSHFGPSACQYETAAEIPSPVLVASSTLNCSMASVVEPNVKSVILVAPEFFIHIAAVRVLTRDDQCSVA